MNITLPPDVVKILRKQAKSGEMSAFIAEAVRHFAKKESHEQLVRRMIEGYQASNKLTAEDQDWLNANLGDSTNED